MNSLYFQLLASPVKIVLPMTVEELRARSIELDIAVKALRARIEAREYADGHWL